MNDIDTLLLQARRRLAVQDHAGMEAACRQVLARHPDHGEALGLMGVAEAQRWNHPQAIIFFRKAWALEPDHAAHGYNLSISLKALGQHGEAEATLRQLLNHAPDHPLAGRDLAILCARRGDFTEALERFEAFLQRQPNQFHTIQAPYLETLSQLIYQHAAALNLEKIFPLVSSMLARGFGQEARTVLDFILEVSPGHPLALEQAADLLMADGKAADSAAAYLALPCLDAPLLDKLALALAKCHRPYQILLLNLPDGGGRRLITDALGLEEEADRLARHDPSRWQGETHLLRGLRHAFEGNGELAANLLGKWQQSVTETRATFPRPESPAFLMYLDFSPLQTDEAPAKGRLLLAMGGSCRHWPQVSVCFTLAHARSLGMENDYLRSRKLLAHLASPPGQAVPPPPPPLAPLETSTLQRLTAGQRQRELAERLHQAQVADFYYTIDIVGACNLKCASCPNGNTDPSMQKHGLMSLDTFRQIVKKIQQERKSANIRIDLYNWGEPCQHPQLPEFVRLVKEAGYKCGLSCNLSRGKNVDGLIAAGPDFIRISLSGVTQAVYGQTHNGGNIASVLANLHKLREAIDRHGVATVVQIGYLLYRHNCGDDLEHMRTLCDELDFLFSPAPAMLMPLEKQLEASGGHIAPADQSVINKLLVPPLEMRAMAMPFRSQHNGCALRQGNLSINFDGSVPLCCAVYDKKYDVAANYLETPEQIIHSQRNTHPLCTLCAAHTSDFVYNGTRFPGLMETVNARVDHLHAGEDIPDSSHGAGFYAMESLIHSFHGKHEASLAALKKATATAPDNPALWFRLGQAHREEGQYQFAIHAFLQALKLQTDFAECRLELAKTYRLTGGISNAIQAYEAYLAARPNHGRALYNLGILHQILGDHDQAMACFRRCLEISPYFLTCLGRLRDYEEICQDGRFHLGETPHQLFLQQGKQAAAEGNRNEALLFQALASSLAPAWEKSLEEIRQLLKPTGAHQVKFSFLVHTHIGHLAANTDLFLRNRTLGKTDEGTLHIFLIPASPANRQLLEMIKRQLPVIESSHLFYLASELLDKTYQHPLIITGNEYFEYRYASSTFSFLEKEEALGRGYLTSKGLDPDSQWFVCIFARDPVYSSTLCERQQADPLSFRNANIDSYHLAIQHIVDRGGFVFRIGSQVEKPLGIRHPRVIDYALEDRTDFLDIYLIAKCRFILGSNSGICDAARVFDTPYLGVNTTPLDWKPYGRGDLFIPKKIRDTHTGHFLTLKEFFARNGINGTALWSDAALHANQLAYASNTAEEILAVTREMIDRLDGRSPSTTEDEKLQTRYHQVFQPNQTGYYVRTPVGREFLRQNRFLCD